MPKEGTEQRKLAAIMFTDMVGYSALGQRELWLHWLPVSRGLVELLPMESDPRLPAFDTKVKAVKQAIRAGGQRRI